MKTIEGLKAAEILKTATTYTETITENDSWWGTREITYTYIEVDGTTYLVDRDLGGWPILLAVD